MRRLRNTLRLLAATFIASALALPLIGGQAATVAVRIDSVKAAAGKETNIPIAIQGAPGIGAMHVELTYDPAVLELQAINKGEKLSDDALMDFNPDEPGHVVIGFATLDDVEGDGTLIVPSFKVIGAKGATSTLSLENLRAWEGENRFDVLVNAQSGEFTVGGGSALPWLYIAIAAGVLLFLLLLLLLRRRQPVAATAGVAPAAPIGAQPQMMPPAQPPISYGPATASTNPQPPVYQAPVSQAPVYQAQPPVYQTPAPQAPVYQTPPPQAPVTAQPVQHTPPPHAPVSQPPASQPGAQPQDQASARFCSQCGVAVQPGQRFCRNCGYRLM